MKHPYIYPTFEGSEEGATLGNTFGKYPGKHPGKYPEKNLRTLRSSHAHTRARAQYKTEVTAVNLRAYFGSSPRHLNSAMAMMLKLMVIASILLVYW